MRKALAAGVLSVLVVGCSTVPTTAIYRQAEGKISQRIHVLPVTDETGRRVKDAALMSLRKDLVESLKASGRFVAVYETLPPNSQQEITHVKSRVSQFSAGARRMVMVTELLQDDSERAFLRLVTHTELISASWPFDYGAVMKKAGEAAVKDIVEKIVSFDGK